MPKINVLDKKIAELIAAGEVVERPASVVKELLENSIDSGANRIEIEIKRGGISLIRITDNGCGIEKSDIKVAFKRHATSKISHKEDLYSINSLGFRGEALASICSVSKVSMISKPADATEGVLYELRAAAETNFQDIGCPNGTTILVEDLFFNTPARLKFLKTDSTEANAIASVVDKIALSHADISFKFIRDGKQVLNTPGNGKLRDAIYSVYGKDFTNTLLELDYEYKNIHISGFICKPEFTKANRNWQLFFINGRYIKSKTASAAIEQAYKGSIMVGKFPACVLNISVSAASIDVNVHPAKIEVRFVDERPIFEAIYHACKSALMENTSIKKLEFKTKAETKKAEFSKITKTSEINDTINQYTKTKKVPALEQLRQVSQLLFKDSQDAQNNQDSTKNYLRNKNNFKPKTYSKSELFENSSINNTIKIESPCPVETKNENSEVFDISNLPEISQTKIENVFENYKYIAEVFSTYIIVESSNSELIFIDKHAAHERLIYEKLKSQKLSNSSQILLKPVIVNLEKNEYAALFENLSQLKQLGFDIEDFGSGKFIIRAVPLNMVDVDDVISCIEEIAGYLLEHKTDILPKKLDYLYHNIACKAAMKAADQSDKMELIKLVEDLKNNPKLKNCPHGRPIFTILTKSDISKQFGR